MSNSNSSPDSNIPLGNIAQDVAEKIIEKKIALSLQAIAYLKLQSI